MVPLPLATPHPTGPLPAGPAVVYPIAFDKQQGMIHEPDSIILLHAPSLTKIRGGGRGCRKGSEGGIKVKYMRRIHKKTCNAIKNLGK